MPGTYTAQVEEQAAEAPIRPSPDVSGICDRSECPAPATHRVVLYEQDFYFCSHHRAELQLDEPAGTGRSSPPGGVDRLCVPAGSVRTLGYATDCER
jgi:hypothetical protein